MRREKNGLYHRDEDDQAFSNSHAALDSRNRTSIADVVLALYFRFIFAIDIFWHTL